MFRNVQNNFQKCSEIINNVQQKVKELFKYAPKKIIIHLQKCSFSYLPTTYMYQKCSEILRNFQKISEIFRNVPKFSDIFRNIKKVQKSYEIFQNIQHCSKLIRHAPKNMFSNTLKGSASSLKFSEMQNNEI